MLKSRRKRLACIGELPVDYDVRCSGLEALYGVPI